MKGKDQIIFATKEDLDQPVSALIRLQDEEDAEEPGLILPDGDINWNCPCLGGMATGPCGVTFREAFSCFHYSQAEPKGSECYEQFRTMQDCMTKYPELYPSKDDGDDVDDKTHERGSAAEDIVDNSSSDVDTQSLSSKVLPVVEKTPS